MPSTSKSKRRAATPESTERKPLLTPEELEEFTKQRFPFENIALEGGGSKGNSYIGTIRVLEEIGVWKNITRFAGASAGAIMAMWAALGYDSYEIEKLLAEDQTKITYDATFGTASLIYNMRKMFGWHPGKRLLNWLGRAVSDKMGDPDLTFADLYYLTGRELCVVVVNVNQLDCMYCHVKTTPTMPIRVAVRMSSAIPGVLAPVKYKIHGVEEIFCDGGLVCNYPIHVFDGWYLSLKQEDNLLRRIPDLRDIESAWDMSTKFGSEPNRKTFGILVYSDKEQEIFKTQLDQRIKKYTKPNPVPQTKKAKSRVKEEEQMDEAAEKHKLIVDALADFVTLLKEHDVDDSGTISRDELKAALDNKESKFTKEQKVLLFGKDISADELFDSLDVDGDGEITVAEMTAYAEQNGFHIRKIFRGFESRKITTVTDYFDSIVETLLLNMKRINMHAKDLQRTIGINTSYLDTLDFDMEAADKEFLAQQGKVACMAFLRHHIELHKQDEADEKESLATGTSKPVKRSRFFSTKNMTVKKKHGKREAVKTQNGMDSVKEESPADVKAEDPAPAE